MSQMGKLRLSWRGYGRYAKPMASFPQMSLTLPCCLPSAPAPSSLGVGLLPHKLQLRDGFGALGRSTGVSTYHLDTLHERQAHSLVTGEAHHTGWGVWGPLQ